MTPHKLHLHHGSVEQASSWQSGGWNSSFIVTSICRLAPKEEGVIGSHCVLCSCYISRFRQNEGWSANALFVWGGAVVSLFVRRFIAAAAAAAAGSFLQTREEVPRTSPFNLVGQPQTTHGSWVVWVCSLFKSHSHVGVIYFNSKAEHIFALNNLWRHVASSFKDGGCVQSDWEKAQKKCPWGFNRAPIYSVFPNHLNN